MEKQGDCTLIEIEQSLPGFDRFIGSWLVRGDVNLLVDVGPASSASRLVDRLENLGVDRIDYVLLTHIHLDHAGGLAECLRRFSGARVVCHDKSVKHLVDPSRLWEGSLKILKEVAEAYGEPKPVSEEVFLAPATMPVKGLTIMETPGHAPHHLSFSFKGRLFSGEAAGNYYAMGDGGYLRPATPPRFFQEVFLGSLDKLMALEDQQICYAHFGEAHSSHEMIARFREQILRWGRMVQEEMSHSPEGLTKRCVDRLLREDPDLKAFQGMDSPMQARERFFISNSVRGYVDFLKSAD